jgi:putative transposase
MELQPASARQWRIPDDLWTQIAPLLPPDRPHPKGGRPWIVARAMLDGIFYVLRTGCQWKALPRDYGAPSTVHDRFQAWVQAGVFRRLWRAGLLTYDEQVGIDWEWPAMAGAMTKAPLGGDSTGPNPTDRAKRGTKRSLLTEARGIPIGLAVAGANRHDMKLVEATLASIPIERPRPTPIQLQHLCLDKGYDYAAVRDTVAAYGYTAHIRTRGEEATAKREIPEYRARRWPVERTHSWLNRFRRLLIRWEKKTDNYLALLHFACAWIAFRAAGVLQPFAPHSPRQPLLAVAG